MKVQIFEDIVTKRRKLRKQGFNFLHKYFRYKEKNYIQSKNVPLFSVSFLIVFIFMVLNPRYFAF